MRTTSSFEVFPNEASERDLARARWLRSEGRIDDAEAAYRSVMREQSNLRSAWTECFELLRSLGRADDALTLAIDAGTTFPNEAFPLTLKGAALMDQGNVPRALEALERAVARDPDLALTWHELGRAAYMLGEGDRAMLALDRAFALEPHTETLVLRGKILRDAGEFYAAEVAFEGARHSAEHEHQAAGIAHEILVTRRQGAFTPRWIRDLTIAEEWFAQHGAIVLACATPTSRPTDVELVTGFVELAADRGWNFGQVAALDATPMWQDLARQLGAPLEPFGVIDPERVPLLLAEELPVHNTLWVEACQDLRRRQRGATLVLRQPRSEAPLSDIVGVLTDGGEPLEFDTDASTTLVMAQHPAALVANRRLHFTEPVPTGQP